MVVRLPNVNTGFSSTRDIIFVSVSISNYRYHIIPRTNPRFLSAWKFLSRECLDAGIGTLRGCMSCGGETGCFRVSSRHLSLHTQANAGVVSCFLGGCLSIAVAPASFLSAGLSVYHTMVLSRVWKWKLAVGGWRMLNGSDGS